MQQNKKFTDGGRVCSEPRGVQEEKAEEDRSKVDDMRLTPMSVVKWSTQSQEIKEAVELRLTHPEFYYLSCRLFKKWLRTLTLGDETALRALLCSANICRVMSNKEGRSIPRPQAFGPISTSLNKGNKQS
ncbi:hypothetical protein Bca4012_083210 [Brassica carinata]